MYVFDFDKRDIFRTLTRALMYKLSNCYRNFGCVTVFAEREIFIRTVLLER